MGNKIYANKICLEKNNEYTHTHFLYTLECNRNLENGKVIMAERVGGVSWKQTIALGLYWQKQKPG